MDAPAVELRGVSKSFGGVRVLDQVDLTLRRGEIHVLAGGNGAGKSTLMKILQGVHTPDEGEILVGGQPARIGSSQAARAHGIAMIFQEFSLIPTLTVAQNVFLTREQRGRAGLLNDRAGARRTTELLADMGVDLDPDATVASLSTAYWQLTEIAKALSQEAQVLIMDEPTASLASGETERLFTLIRRLRDRGISIVYISHRMGEIFQVADRITVLRDGRRVVTVNAADLTSAELVDHIAGRRMEQAMQWTPRQVPRQGTPLLEVNGLTAGRLRGVGFTLYPGEVLGVAGLMGSGRSTLLRTLFGVHRAAGGQVLVNGRPVRIRRPRDAVAAGVALVPEDRRAQGLVLGHSVRDNLLLPLLGRLSGGGVIDDRKGDEITGSLVRDLDIHTTSTARPVRLLSGGNQQKVVLAKWLGTSPGILLLDEPTAGVDISTKTEIVAKVRELADTGKGIVIVSSELPELLAVSDRVLILRDGRVDARLDRGDIPGEDALHLAVQGVEMPDAPERPPPGGGSWGPTQDDDEKERDDG